MLEISPDSKYYKLVLFMYLFFACNFKCFSPLYLIVQSGSYEM